MHPNHLYSVAALTDNSGNVAERYRYDRAMPVLMDAGAIVPPGGSPALASE